MSKYKYPFGATWISHSTITDFEKCPRLYWLRNVYKDPVVGKKVQIVNPYLTLGMAVHDTIEQIRYLPREVRFEKPLTHIFEEVWVNCEGEMGGFKNTDEEKDFKTRGYEMVKRVENNPGPLKNLSIALKAKGEVVSSMLLTEDIVLCGNVDWVEVLGDGSLHIIDFKTGKNEEKTDSLQLPIYLLLAAAFSPHRPVTKLSYWYLNKSDLPAEVSMPNMEGVWEQLKTTGESMRNAKNAYPAGIPCPYKGCRYCKEYDSILKGEAKRVGFDRIREKILFQVI